MTAFCVRFGISRPGGVKGQLRAARSAVWALALAMVLGACVDSVTGPQSESCGPPPYFHTLPVAEIDLSSVSVFGGVDGPGHTLPTPHGGMFLARENTTLRSPGDIAVTELRRVRYAGSPTRQGHEDYAIFFQVCKEIRGWFGHVSSLAPVFGASSIQWRDCSTYSTAQEQIQSCTARGLDIKVAAGEVLGAGGPPGGARVIDFGLLDARVNHFYMSPGRHPPARFQAVCMWEQFDAASQAILFSKLRDIVRPAIVPTGDPRCGTMEVDVVGTAKGVWAESGVTGPVGGDETRYMTLANYPYRPQDYLVLSIGPATLGARTTLVPRLASGRVNRAFEHVTPDGQIYCYGPDAHRDALASWFLSLTSATTLRIELRTHAPGASPCGADPATWSFGPSAVSMVR